MKWISGSDGRWSDGAGSLALDGLGGLLVLLAIAGAVLFAGLGRRGGRRRSVWTRPRSIKRGAAPDLRDPDQQIAAVGKVGFARRPLLNRTEYRVLLPVERAARQLGSGYRVMAQTSLGEIIRPCPEAGTRGERDEAFAAINSKRLDLAVFDSGGRIVLAVEVQGSGHHLGGNAFKRDAVKREALRRAGVPMLEVDESWSAAEIEARVLKIVRGDGAAGTRPAQRTSPGGSPLPAE